MELKEAMKAHGRGYLTVPLVWTLGLWICSWERVVIGWVRRRVAGGGRVGELGAGEGERQQGQWKEQVVRRVARRKTQVRRIVREWHEGEDEDWKEAEGVGEFEVGEDNMAWNIKATSGKIKTLIASVRLAISEKHRIWNEKKIYGSYRVGGRANIHIQRFWGTYNREAYWTEVQNELWDE
jgi:hypothetical protein